MTTHTGTLPFTLDVTTAGYSLTDGGASPPPPPAAGGLPKLAFAEYTANADLSATIPADDTTPTSSEGTQILSAVFAASQAGALITVDFSGVAVHTTTAGAIIAALFVDNETSARRVGMVTALNAGYWVNLNLKYQYAPGDTAPHTYKIRVGPAAGAIRFNGAQSSRYFGGAAATTLIVSEAGGYP